MTPGKINLIGIHSQSSYNKTINNLFHHNPFLFKCSYGVFKGVFLRVVKLALIELGYQKEHLNGKSIFSSISCGHILICWQSVQQISCQIN